MQRFMSGEAGLPFDGDIESMRLDALHAVYNDDFDTAGILLMTVKNDISYAYGAGMRGNVLYDTHNALAGRAKAHFKWRRSLTEPDRSYAMDDINAAHTRLEDEAQVLGSYINGTHDNRRQAEQVLSWQALRMLGVEHFLTVETTDAVAITRASMDGKFGERLERRDEIARHMAEYACGLANIENNLVVDNLKLLAVRESGRY